MYLHRAAGYAVRPEPVEGAAQTIVPEPVEGFTAVLPFALSPLKGSHWSASNELALLVIQPFLPVPMQAKPPHPY